MMLTGKNRSTRVESYINVTLSTTDPTSDRACATAWAWSCRPFWPVNNERLRIYTRWFKYDSDWLCRVYKQM